MHVRVNADANGTRSGTRRLFTAWDQIHAQLLGADRIVLLADFDGTLVPLQKRPAEARMPSEMRRLSRTLVQAGTAVEIISGRSIEGVQKKVGIPGIWYAGSHGYFVPEPRGRRISLLPIGRTDSVGARCTG